MILNSDYNLDKEVTRELLESERVYATTLRAILNAAYGDQIYEVDVLELFMDLEQDFNIKISEEVENKLNALMFAVTYPHEFFMEEEAFVGVCNSLLGGDVGDVISVLLDDLTVAELLWSIYEVEINLPDEIQVKYSPEVEAVIDRVLDTESLDDEEEAKVIYENFMIEHKSELQSQLIRLGFEEIDVKNLTV